MTKVIICNLFIIIYPKVGKNIDSCREIVVQTISACSAKKRKYLTEEASVVKYDKK